MSNLFAELRRRNVFRVAGVYAVVGWVLAQISTTLEEALGLPVWFDGLIVALLMLGLPIAILFAWAFEMTPNGVVRTEKVPEGQSITADTGHKLDYAIVTGFVLVATMIIWQQFGPATTDELGSDTAEEVAGMTTDDASIAVLPFADLSPAGDQEYFSDGIAEEILNVLVGVDGLDIVSRTSSFQFKGRGLGIPEIARELKVRHIVEGSVRKSGNAIRVTAQLIDAREDKHLWSQTYDRPLTAENIFEIQDEIANAIVSALSDALGIGNLEPVQVTATTRNLTAYELFLQARPLFQARLDLDVADDLLAEALEKDPLFAKAWEMRAALQTLRVEYGYSDETADAAEQLADEFAMRALKIEPRSATALAVLAKNAGNASQSLRKKANIADIIATLDRALEIEPRNASALNWRGLRFVHVGYLEAALHDFKTCLDFEPLYVPCSENRYVMLSVMGRDTEALEAFGVALDKSLSKLYYSYLPMLARMEKPLAFKLAANDILLLGGWRQHNALYEAYRHPGEDHSQLIESIHAFMSKRGGRYLLDYNYMVLPIGADAEIPENVLMWDPSLHKYRQSNSFKSYMRATGALEYWQDIGYPQQCRPLGDDDFECD